MHYIIKGMITSLVIWVLLFLVFFVSGHIIKCPISVENFYILPEGIDCWNPLQSFVLSIMIVLNILFFLVAYSSFFAHLSIEFGMGFFWFCSLISFLLWGIFVSYFSKLFRKSYF